MQWDLWRRIIFALALVSLSYSTAAGLKDLLQIGGAFTGILMFIDGAAACGILLCAYFEYRTALLHEQIVGEVMSKFPKMLGLIFKDLQDKGLMHPEIDISTIVSSTTVDTGQEEDQDTSRPPGATH